MSFFVCPDCRKQHEIFGCRGKFLEERFGVEVLARWPLREEFIGTVNPATASSMLVQETADAVVRAAGKIGLRRKEIPAVEFDAQHVTLTWPDGEQARVANRDLRLSCQCALCIDERSGRKLLKETDVRPDIAPKRITPLGNYAIGITWNDGHSSGIYPYTNILEEAKRQRSKKQETEKQRTNP